MSVEKAAGLQGRVNGSIGEGNILPEEVGASKQLKLIYTPGKGPVRVGKAIAGVGKGLIWLGSAMEEIGAIFQDPQYEAVKTQEPRTTDAVEKDNKLTPYRQFLLDQFPRGIRRLHYTGVTEFTAGLALIPVGIVGTVARVLPVADPGSLYRGLGEMENLYLNVACGIAVLGGIKLTQWGHRNMQTAINYDVAKYISTHIRRKEPKGV